MQERQEIQGRADDSGGNAPAQSFQRQDYAHRVRYAQRV